jgi:5'-methylthioadenosine phosphorylase
MKVAIIGGTGVNQLPGLSQDEQVVETPYGQAVVSQAPGGPDSLVFMNRHGPQRQNPPHKINYRANLKALQMLGVKQILATNAVGSINPEMPPRSLIALTDFLDFTSGRASTYYDGGAAGHAYTDLNQAYCPALRGRLLALAVETGLEIRPHGTYVCTDGPRFETPAEILMYARLGADVVGMTGVPEVVLAKELGLHYAAVAYSINWAAGLEQDIQIVREGIPELIARLLAVFVRILEYPEPLDCTCENSVHLIQPPQEEGGVY